MLFVYLLLAASVLINVLLIIGCLVQRKQYMRETEHFSNLFVSESERARQLQLDNRLLEARLRHLESWQSASSKKQQTLSKKSVKPPEQPKPNPIRSISSSMHSIRSSRDTYSSETYISDDSSSTYSPSYSSYDSGSSSDSGGGSCD